MSGALHTALPWLYNDFKDSGDAGEGPTSMAYLTERVKAKFLCCRSDRSPGPDWGVILRPGL